MLNVSPIGRNCTQEERIAFFEFDKVCRDCITFFPMHCWCSTLTCRCSPNLLLGKTSLFERNHTYLAVFKLRSVAQNSLFPISYVHCTLLRVVSGKMPPPPPLAERNWQEPLLGPSRIWGIFSLLGVWSNRHTCKFASDWKKLLKVFFCWLVCGHYDLWLFLTN